MAIVSNKEVSAYTSNPCEPTAQTNTQFKTVFFFQSWLLLTSVRADIPYMISGQSPLFPRL